MSRGFFGGGGGRGEGGGGGEARGLGVRLRPGVCLSGHSPDRDRDWPGHLGAWEKKRGGRRAGSGGEGGTFGSGLGVSQETLNVGLYTRPKGTT